MEKKWIIHQLERIADSGFVVTVHWRLAMTDTDESGKTYYADTYSMLTYTQDPESTEYIPYEELTEGIVVGWVEESLGEERLAEMEGSLIANIEAQKNPPILKGLPWE